MNFRERMTGWLQATPGLLESLLVGVLVIGGFVWGIGVLQMFLWAAFGWAFLLRTPRSTGLAIWLALPALKLLRKYYSGAGLDARAGSLRFGEFVPNASDRWASWLLKAFLMLPLVLVMAAYFFPVVLIAYVAGIVLLLAYIGACRVVATLFCAFRHPVEALRAMPRAWRRTLWQTSLAATWELVPGLSRFYRLARGEAWAGHVGVDHPRQLLRTGFDRAGLKKLAITFAAVATLLGAAILALWVSFNASRFYPSGPDFIAVAETIPNDRAEDLLDGIRAGKSTEDLLPHLRQPNANYADEQRSLLESLRHWVREESMERPTQIEFAKRLLALADMPDDRMRNARVDLLSDISPFNPLASVELIFIWVHSHVPASVPRPVALVLGVLGTAPFVVPWSVAVGALVYAMASVFRSPLRLVLYLPSLVYRLVLKATCLLYFPMIWVFEPKYARFDEPKQLIEDLALHPYTTMGAFLGALGVGVWVIKQGLAHLNPMARQLLPNGPAASYFYTIHVYDFLMFASALLAIWFWLRARLLERQREVDLTDARRLVMLGRVRKIFASYSLLVFVLGAWPHLPSIRIVLPEDGWLPRLTSEA